MAEHQRKMLQALSLKAKDTVQYYDFVTVRVSNDGGGVLSYGNAANSGGGPTTRRVYFCVGKRSIVLLRANLQRMARGGVVEYDWLDKVIEDTRTPTEFAISINSRRSSDCPPHFVCSSQNRATLLNKMYVCYLADSMLRLGKVEHFPKHEAELDTDALGAKVLPFRGYKEAVLEDYYFLIRNEFEEVASTSGVKTGVYKAPVHVIIPSAARGDREAEMEVQLHIYKPVLISDLGLMAREHIRWLAMEYKQALLRTQQTYVLRNKLFLKKMNLSNDVAAWMGWELFLQDAQYLTVVILLRRQYAPPLVDTAQDFAFVFKVPAGAAGDKRTKELQEDVTHEAHIMADSLTTLADNPVLCTDIIQAKLDSLLYDEEACSWIRSRLKLRPEGLTHLEKYGAIFVKGILKILQDENALEHPELWDDASKRVSALCEKKSEQDLDPLIIANQVLLAPAEGVQVSAEDAQTLMTLNAWRSRVARFLAYCCDGGLFGSKFTLTDIISNLVQDKVSQTSGRKLAQVLAFLVHFRPKDVRKPWEPKLLQNQLVALGLLDIGPNAGSQETETADAGNATFNDRVMQAMVETGYLVKLLPPSKDDGEMSAKYACLLHYMLQSDQASVNLKAAICRVIISKKDANHGGVLCVGLMHVLRNGGLFLATYATAALVNLCAHEYVKNYLMHEGNEAAVLNQLDSKDDDLTLYTLMLLVNCTKSSGHRSMLLQRGILDKLYRILSANYAVLNYKRRVLTELCSVLGQLCNDEETRIKICEKYQYVMDCLLQIFETAELLNENLQPGDRKPGETLPAASAKVISKVLFALKQLCANSAENKDLVGNRVIKAVVKDLQNSANLEHKDWATNAILLLLLLAISHTNCHLINDAGWQDTFVMLSSSQLGKLDATRDRISQIDYRVDTLVQAGS